VFCGFDVACLQAAHVVVAATSEISFHTQLFQVV